MDNLLEELYEKYDYVLRDLLIGRPLLQSDLNEMWNMIHKHHFTNFQNDASLIYNILEYYEYM